MRNSDIKHNMRRNTVADTDGCAVRHVCLEVGHFKCGMRIWFSRLLLINEFRRTHQDAFWINRTSASEGKMPALCNLKILMHVVLVL